MPPSAASDLAPSEDGAGVRYRDFAAACAIGIGSSWNIANVGPAADGVAAHYGVAVAVIGFFTTLVFAGEFIAMATIAGMLERFGVRLLGALAVAVCVAVNLLTLPFAGIAVALALRLLVGVGVGWGFVCGAAYVQRSGGGALHQGIYGGVSLAAGGSAVAIVPVLGEALGWRAPFVFAAVAGTLTLPFVLIGTEVRADGGARRERPVHQLLGDRRLMRFAVVHSASFGISIVLSNWVVAVLSHGSEYSEADAGLIGALILILGIVSRPGGGLFVHLRPDRARAMLATVVIAGAIGSVLLGAVPMLPLALMATILIGFSSGAPFGTLVAGVVRLFPDSPGAAFAAMNSYALALIIVGTPLVGLTVSMPGHGMIGFAACGVFCALAGLFLPPQRLLVADAAAADVDPQGDAGLIDEP